MRQHTRAVARLLLSVVAAVALVGWWSAVSGWEGTTSGEQCYTGCGGGGAGGGGGGGGGSGGSTPPPFPTVVITPTPTPSPIPVPQQTPIPPFNFVPYTFNSQYCQNSNNFVDPINVVFAGSNTSWQAVQSHAADHGGWGDQGGSNQWFQEVSTCYLMNGQSASGPIGQIPGRFHMRYRQGSVPIKGYGTVILADAHHENVSTAIGCRLVNHVVDHNADNGGVSGFDMGKQDIIDNWGIGGSGHTPLSYFYFNNRNPMKQCDFNPLLLNYSWSSDGTAVVVPMP